MEIKGIGGIQFFIKKLIYQQEKKKKNDGCCGYFRENYVLNVEVKLVIFFFLEKKVFDVNGLN